MTNPIRKRSEFHFYFIYGFLFFLAIAIMPHRAAAIQAIPGSTWDQISYDADSLVGAGTMGYLNQGIDWFKLPGGITFNTFAEFRYRFRSEYKDYFNAYGEALGIELRKSIFHIGADYYWQRFPALPDYSNKFQYYLSGFYDWDLKDKKTKLAKGFPGSTWDYLSYDVDSLEGAGAMGYINQGVDWFTLHGGITFNTFAEFRYRFRSENKDYYNMYGEAVGVEFKKSIFHLGIDYFWQQFPALPDYSNKVQFYLTWFYDWDLKPTTHK